MSVDPPLLLAEFPAKPLPERLSVGVAPVASASLRARKDALPVKVMHSTQTSSPRPGQLRRHLLKLTALCVSALFYCSALQAGGDKPRLPELGNTPEADAEMAIEISDQFVWPPPEAETIGAKREKLDLWLKIATSKRMPMHITPVVNEYKKRLKKENWSYEKLLNRATPFLFHIVDRLEARGLPLDLALLPVIESGYQSHVQSENQAAGLWQIVPATAGEIGLKRSTWFDDRSDVVKSTRAALDYLSFINAEFDGNWELTLAAYNAGPARVKSAIRNNREREQPTDFWSLHLPTETSVYVARFAALSELVRQTPSAALKLPEVPAKPYLESVDAGSRISLNIAAALTDVPEKHLRKINGGLLYGVTPPEGPHTLMLPVSKVEQFRLALDKMKTAGKTLYQLPKTHKVAAGDSIGSIAIKYGLTQRELREMNRLDNDLIKIGQKLAVLQPAPTLDSAVADESNGTGAPAGKAVGYTIQNGDTLSHIALKFKVAVEQIRMENGKVPNARRLIPGQRVQIFQRES